MTLVTKAFTIIFKIFTAPSSEMKVYFLFSVTQALVEIPSGRNGPSKEIQGEILFNGLTIGIF